LSHKVTRTRPVTTGFSPYHYHLGGYNLQNRHDTIDADVVATNLGLPEIKGTQTTVSEGHPFRARQKLVGDLGGEFYTEKLYFDQTPSGRVHSWHVDTNVNGYRRLDDITMSVFPTNPYGLPWPAPIHSDDSAMDALGATAIARCKPTNSVADAATFLGETLKDGLPHLVGSQSWEPRTRAAKKAAKEYLNVEFGWKPLLNDIRSFATAVKHADSVLKQFERDSGKTVRRRYNFPVERHVEETVIATNARPWTPASNSYWFDDALGTVTKTVETVTSRWFSGAFTYHLPTGSDTRSAMTRYALEADKLFGILPTPETLWEIAPWSWAVDWFSNTGDVVSNLTDWAIYGLVMRYGYMMEQSIVRHTYSYEGPPGFVGLEGFVQPFSLVREVKKRRQANPFGFGVTWEGLSPTQGLIAAALGLVRGLK